MPRLVAAVVKIVATALMCDLKTAISASGFRAKFQITGRTIDDSYIRAIN